MESSPTESNDPNVIRLRSVLILTPEWHYAHSSFTHWTQHLYAKQAITLPEIEWLREHLGITPY